MTPYETQILHFGAVSALDAVSDTDTPRIRRGFQCSMTLVI
uniref:Uncharacterized protein n=1 Tax=Arundo donax TaxID=35708 RepID=A0A0A9CDX5_ARUDO